jgi:hypothetical protein
MKVFFFFTNNFIVTVSNETTQPVSNSEELNHDETSPEVCHLVKILLV